MTKLSDQWQTPDWLFQELNNEFHFDIDLCATEDNHKCKNWCHDYLAFEARDLAPTCFMNPPYSNPKPFIEKAWEDSKHCKIVCLVKCDPSTQWWATFWQYSGPWYRGPKPGCQVRFVPKRIQFDPPQQLIDSGEVWKEGRKWVQKCNHKGSEIDNIPIPCVKCKRKGYKELSGPTFPSALLIFDRREL